jgi:hypothetical protein
VKSILIGVLAFIVGAVIGGFVNMGLIVNAHLFIPYPESVDPSNMDSLKAAMPTYEMKHFIMPFLAHALGTLVGAFVAAFIATTARLPIALGVGVLFLVGGVMMVMDLPSPMWFNVLDLVGAYIPMGYLGYLIAIKIRK